MSEVRQDIPPGALRVPDPRFEGLTIASGLSTALCMVCVLGATCPVPAYGMKGGNP
ncbi:MAG: hypothetical protein ACRDS9_18510 [Pseudonocardiaceae bacterium]